MIHRMDIDTSEKDGGLVERLVGPTLEKVDITWLENYQTICVGEHFQLLPCSGIHFSLAAYHSAEGDTRVIPGRYR
jgi:hypothetical protein